MHIQQHFLTLFCICICILSIVTKNIFSAGRVKKQYIDIHFQLMVMHSDDKNSWAFCVWLAWFQRCFNLK